MQKDYTEDNNEKLKAVKKITNASISLIPIVGNNINAISDIIEGITDLHKIKQQNKIIKLFNDWLDGSHNLNEDEIKQAVEKDDFYLIIKKVLEEDDDSKIIYYARLLKISSKPEYTTDNKKALISILYHLTANDIALAKKFHIYSKTKTFTEDERDKKYQQLSLTNDGFILASLNNLKNYGLFKTQQTFGAGEIYIPTILLNVLAEIIFNEQELAL